ncbi:MAG: hypothetical protein ACE5GZ_00205 [Gammaproteobacteria bacterium]
MHKSFSNKKIFSRLAALCKSNKTVLPCELDSWHTFSSDNVQVLVDLGARFENLGWRFVGIWPDPEGTAYFHLRVARKGLYGETQLLKEIKMMKTVAAEFPVVNYSNCSHKPVTSGGHRNSTKLTA